MTFGNIAICQYPIYTFNIKVTKLLKIYLTSFFYYIYKITRKILYTKFTVYMADSRNG